MGNYVPPLHPCGTQAAYVRNRKLAKEGKGCGPCAECVEAHRVCMSDPVRVAKKKAGDKRYGATRKKEKALYDLTYNYGITPQQHADLLEKQNNMCGLCKLPFKIGPRSKHLDHNHDTNATRGILHLKCNNLIARARESEFVLTNAISYLRKHK